MPWYCATVPPLKELAAVAALRPHCEAFSPVEYVHVRRGRSILNKPAPVIVRPKAIYSRYVFVRDPDWYTIRTLELPGTGRPVITGWLTDTLTSWGRPAPLRDSELLDILAIHENGPPSAIPAARDIHPGDTAIIITGPFEGHRVKVRRIDGTSAAVELQFLNSMREVPIEISALEAA